MKKVVLISCAVLVLFIGAGSAVGQDVVLAEDDSVRAAKRATLPAYILNAPRPIQSIIKKDVISITAPEVIEWIDEQGAYFWDPLPDRIEYIDIDGDTPGSRDVLITYPSEDVLLVGEEAATVSAYLTTLDPPENAFSNASSDVLTAESFDPEDPAYRERPSIGQAASALFSDVLYAVRRVYGDQGSIKLWLNRTSEGQTELLATEFDPDQLTFRRKPDPIPDSVSVFDLLYTTLSDSLVKADTTLYDLLFVNTRIEETRYILPPSADSTAADGF